MKQFIITNKKNGNVVFKCETYVGALDEMIALDNYEKHNGTFEKDSYELDIVEKLDNKTIKLVNDFARSMKELSDHWFELTDKENDIISKAYPFKESFDEMSIDAMHWAYLINKTKYN
jgi:hypothetical protein